MTGKYSIRTVKAVCEDNQNITLTVTGKYRIRAVSAVCEDNQDITVTVTGKYSIWIDNVVKITRISHSL